MTFQRLDAIATGILAIAAGGVTIAVSWTPFWETWQRALRQQQTTGTVVALEITQTCRQIQRGNPFKCSRREKEPCPVVQYQAIGVNQPLQLRDCSQSASVGTVFEVMYDRQSPTNAYLVGPSTGFVEGTSRLWASMPVGFGILLLILGGSKFWSSDRDRP
ncbi:DUF3592 domain-containing protein [Synechococcus elongatus IITB7]|uniref:DUF3592 domain-containing protein n=1 Tax=Synechococcus elongatus TaxID=32046 RepID=UPI0030CB2941